MTFYPVTRNTSFSIHSVKDIGQSQQASRKKTTVYCVCGL